MSPPSSRVNFGGGLLLSIVMGQGSLGSMSPVLGGGIVVGTPGPIVGGTGGPIIVGPGGLSGGGISALGATGFGGGLGLVGPPIMIPMVG
jgi:hypothetical protein